MKKIKVFLIIAAVSISLLTIGVVEVGGKSNNPDVVHKIHEHEVQKKVYDGIGEEKGD